MMTKHETDSIAVQIMNGAKPAQRRSQDEERKRVLLVSLVVAILVSLIVLIILTIPAYRYLREAQASVSEEAQRLERLFEVSYAYDTLHAAVGREADAIAQAERALPSAYSGGLSDIPERLAVIEAIAVREAGGVLIENLDIMSSSELKPLDGVQNVGRRRIIVEGLAGTDSFKRFLGVIRNSLHLMDPVRADLAYASEGVITFSLELDGYVLTQ